MIDQDDPKVTEATFAKLQADKKNYNCIDCNAVGAQWASVNNAIFICLKCAGTHRGMGVQVSFVRSITLDGWSAKQLKMMTLGGNQRISDHFAKYDIMDMPARERYKTNAAEYYRE